MGFRAVSGIGMFQCPIGLGAGTKKPQRFVPRNRNIRSIPPPLSMVKQAFIDAPNIHFRAGKKLGLTWTTAGNFFG